MAISAIKSVFGVPTYFRPIHGIPAGSKVTVRYSATQMARVDVVTESTVQWGVLEDKGSIWEYLPQYIETHKE